MFETILRMGMENKRMLEYTHALKLHYGGRKLSSPLLPSLEMQNPLLESVLH